MRDALAALPYEVVASLARRAARRSCAAGEDYGVPLVESLEAGRRARPEVVVDLSDEPVLGPRGALPAGQPCAALRGCRTSGADFRFDPPAFEPFALPSLAVIGTGKRVGKTAVAGHLARLLARDRDVVVVAMGRGGPPEPELVEARPTLERPARALAFGPPRGVRLPRDRGARGRADDRLPPLRRRARGRTVVSNVLAGAALAAEREPDVVVFDGSGAAIPPVAADARVLVDELVAADRRGYGLPQRVPRS